MISYDWFPHGLPAAVRRWRALAVVLSAVALGHAGGLGAFQAGGARAPGADAPVEVIVRVLDRSGRFVHGLGADEFELHDRGQRQPVAYFEEISRPPAVSPAAVHVPDTTSAVARNEDPARARLFVLVLDSTGTSPADSVGVRVAARTFVEQHLAASDLVSVFLTGDGTPGAQEFATDRAAALSAIDRFAAAGCGRNSRLAAADLGAAIGARLTSVRGHRVSLLWIGASGLSATDRRQRTAIDTLRQARVVVYPVDPRRLGTRLDSLAGADQGLLAQLPRRPPASCGMTPAALQDFADETGGFAIVEAHQFDDALARIADENTRYYLLRFHPGTRPRAGEFLSVDVRVPGRSDLRVAGRPGYGVVPAPEAALAVDVEPPLAAALTGVLPSADLPVSAQAIARGGRVYLVVEVPGQALPFTEADGQYHEALSFALTGVDPVAPLSRTPSPRVGQVERLSLHLSPAQFEAVKRTSVRWLSSLDLGSGHHSLRVAVHAAGANRTGSVALDVDVPWADERAWWLGGVAVTSDAARLSVTSGLVPAELGLSGPPTTTRTFALGAMVTLSAGVRTPVDSGRATFRLSVAPVTPTGVGTPLLERSVAVVARAAVERPRAWNIDTRLIGAGRFAARLSVEDERGRSAETGLLLDIAVAQGVAPLRPQ